VGEGAFCDQSEVCIVRGAIGHPALDLRHHTRRKSSEDGDILVAPLPRGLIEGAERAEDFAITSDEWNSSVRAYRCPALGQNRVCLHVAYHKRFTAGYDILTEARTERSPARRRSSVSALGALEVLPIGVDERYQDSGNAQQLRRKAREGIEVLLFRRTEKSRFLESGQPRRIA
jgi:hypothetical protein